MASQYIGAGSDGAGVELGDCDVDRDLVGDDVDLVGEGRGGSYTDREDDTQPQGDPHSRTALFKFRR